MVFRNPLFEFEVQSNWSFCQTEIFGGSSQFFCVQQSLVERTSIGFLDGVRFVVHDALHAIAQVVEWAKLIILVSCLRTLMDRVY